MAIPSARDPQYEVHNNSAEQRNGKDRRPQSIIKASLSALPYALCPPVERKQRINHRSHCDECEQASTDLADLIAKVEKPDCEAAEDDGEVEP
jgi:hypothetical protein